MGKTIIGVMGQGGGAREEDVRAAFELGTLIAQEGWVLLTGGRAAGVMDAASRGAKSAGGLTVGILPGETAAGASEALDIPIVTALGEARNNVNVLTSRVVVACGAAGAGTASEIALALKARKPVILLGATDEARAFFASLGGERVSFAGTPREAVEIVKRLVDGEASR
ncbi:MAG: cytochrome [Acidobacteria bacterium]|nr:cytochrome [Acidobacteriota bacterium]